MHRTCRCPVPAWPHNILTSLYNGRAMTVIRRFLETQVEMQFRENNLTLPHLCEHKYCLLQTGSLGSYGHHSLKPVVDYQRRKYTSRLCCARSGPESPGSRQPSRVCPSRIKFCHPLGLVGIDLDTFISLIAVKCNWF